MCERCACMCGRCGGDIVHTSTRAECVEERRSSSHALSPMRGPGRQRTDAAHRRRGGGESVAVKLPEVQALPGTGGGGTCKVSESFSQEVPMAQALAARKALRKEHHTYYLHLCEAVCT
jgi:hypothetical protein